MDSRNVAFSPIDKIVTLRGGQSSEDPSYAYANYQQQQQQRQGNEEAYADGFANYNASPDANDIFHETVQERVDKWRMQQMQKSQSMTDMQQANPRDEQGRMKLLASVSKGSRAFIFFVLMWRDIHLFEVADQNLKGTLRLMVVVPLTLLFIGNMAGMGFSLTTTGYAAKKRMKAVLNLDKLVEAVLLVWYFIRLTVLPSKYVPREIYISNVLHSIFFLIQCQAYTRVTWDQSTANQSYQAPAQSQTYQQQQAWNGPGQNDATTYSGPQGQNPSYGNGYVPADQDLAYQRGGGEAY